MIDLLLRNHADINILTKDGKSAKDISKNQYVVDKIEKWETETINFLIKMENVFFDNEESSDVVIQFSNEPNEKIFAHKVFLSQSIYLKYVMEGLKNEKECVIIEKFEKSHIARKAVRWLYGINIDFDDSENEMYFLYNIACKWVLIDLQDLICIKLSDLSNVDLIYCLIQSSIEKKKSMFYWKCLYLVKLTHEKFINDDEAMDLLKNHWELYKTIARLPYISMNDLKDEEINYVEENLIIRKNQSFAALKLLKDHLSTLFLNPLFFNLILVSKDKKKFFVHKEVLILESDYFERMLLNKFVEAKQDVIEMNDINEVELSNILCFLYQKKISTKSIDTIFNLIVLSDKYLMKRLKRICEIQIKEFTTKENTIDHVLKYGYLTEVTSEFNSIKKEWCNFYASSLINQLIKQSIVNRKLKKENEKLKSIIIEYNSNNEEKNEINLETSFYFDEKE